MSRVSCVFSLICAISAACNLRRRGGAIRQRDQRVSPLHRRQATAVASAGRAGTASSAAGRIRGKSIGPLSIRFRLLPSYPLGRLRARPLLRARREISRRLSMMSWHLFQRCQCGACHCQPLGPRDQAPGTHVLPVTVAGIYCPCPHTYSEPLHFQ